MCLVCLLVCNEEGSSPVSAITEKRDMGMYGGAIVFIFLFVGFWDGDYVNQLLYVWYYVGVKSGFQHAREECESKRAYVLGA